MGNSRQYGPDGLRENNIIIIIISIIVGEFGGKTRFTLKTILM